MSEIALFGGSFDPPHIGHQLVISYLLTQNFEQVWVIPAFKHAMGKNLTDFEHRYNMVAVIAQDFNRVRTSRAEEKISKEPGFVHSLTINLVRYIKETRPLNKYRLVIGSDLEEQAKTWDYWDEICEIAPPYIVGRIGYGEGHFMLPNISSTQIKASIAEGSLDKLVPHHVAEYIKKHGLYGAVQPSDLP